MFKHIKHKFSFYCPLPAIHNSYISFIFWLWSLPDLIDQNNAEMSNSYNARSMTSICLISRQKTNFTGEGIKKSAQFIWISRIQTRIFRRGNCTIKSFTKLMFPSLSSRHTTRVLCNIQTCFTEIQTIRLSTRKN
jgi:hypothetical protein